MTGDDIDRDLAARFARLREEDHARGEGYAPFATRAAAAARMRARPRRLLAIPALAAVAAMIALALALRGRPGGTAPPAVTGVDLSATSLRMPTDFLLDTPGSELLQSVPAIGSDIITVGTTPPSPEKRS